MLFQNYFIIDNPFYFMKFSRFNTFIFDLDGTIWNWFNLFPGVKIAINKLQSKNKQVLFITNNTILSRSGLTRKLRNFGIKVSEDELVNAGYAAAQFFKKRKGNAIAFGEGLIKDLKSNGIKIVNKPYAKYVAIGQDLKFNFDKLALAHEAIRNKAELFATAKGRYFTYGNDIIPGTGVLVQAVEYVSNKKAVLLGKPSDHMIDVLKKFVDSDRVLIVGDELNSDIIMGERAGYSTALIKTGVDKKPGKDIKVY